MEEEINNKPVEDAEFPSQDGTVNSMFSHQTNNGDSEHCDGLIVRPPKIFWENLDEDETPPGCEELGFPSDLQPIIASSLKTYSNSALIGLEYIVEVHPDASANMNRTTRAFYICVLCEKRCDIMDSIVKHMESSAHRLSYLRKYLPRAYSLFLQADPCIENWTAEIHQYMEAIISRIESLKGRLQVLPCHRTRWDVKRQHFRTKIELGIHLRETPDLVYYDISSPFITTTFENRGNKYNVTPDGPGVSQSDSLLVGGTEQINAKKDSGTRLGQEAVILLSDDSLSETDSSMPGTGGKVSSKVPQKILWPKSSISKSASVNDEEDVAKKQSVNHPLSDDDDIIVEKEIFGKGIVQKSNSPQQSELCSTLRSRSRSPKHSELGSRDCNTVSKSRSPKRLRSRYNSKGHNTVSKPRSPSRSPKKLRSGFISGKQKPPKHRDLNGSSIKSDQISIGCEHLGTHRGEKHRLRSPMRTKEHPKNIRSESRLLRKFEKEFSSFKEMLRRKRSIYKERPEDHPLYADEWKDFWKKRCTKLEKDGKNPVSYDFKPDWFAFWFSRMKKLEKKEIETKKMELKKKYGLIDGKTDTNNFAVEREQKCTTESSKNREAVQFDWKNRLKKTEVTHEPGKNLEIIDQTKNLPCTEDATLPTEMPSTVVSPSNAYSFEELRVFQSPTPTYPIAENTSQIPRDVPLPSDSNLLQVLRMLVTLEDCLGSLGPSITNLFTRALSAERCETGSSSKLLKEDSTCVDLLDTSREKLKGLLLAGILDGVKGTAASQAVEHVTRLLKLSSVTSHSCTPMGRSVGFNMASLINNLQAAGLLHPPQSTPKLLSAIGSSGVAEMKDKDSAPSANNLCGSRFEKNVRFSGEELQTLIVNFRTLTASQKRDLVKYLHQLEQTSPKNEVANQSETVSSSSSPPLSNSSSPLSKKFRHYQSCKVINPMAPIPPSVKTRYPTILEMTGLSCIDLKNHGIPLEELDSPYTSMPEDSRLCRSDDGISPSTAYHPPHTYLLNANRQSPLGQSLQRSAALGTLQWGGISVQQKSIIPHSVEKQQTEKDEIYVVESISSQQHSFIPQQCQGSFCYQQLDPRRNRMRHRNDTSFPNPSYSFKKSQNPIVIPTSPILQRMPREKDLVELSSDAWQFNRSSKTSSPLKGNGNGYW